MKYKIDLKAKYKPKEFEIPVKNVGEWLWIYKKLAVVKKGAPLCVKIFVSFLHLADFFFISFSNPKKRKKESLIKLRRENKDFVFAFHAKLFESFKCQ